MYDLALLAGLPATLAVAAEVVLLAALLAGRLAHRRRRDARRVPGPDDAEDPPARTTKPFARSSTKRRLRTAAIGSTALAATAMALSWAWWLVWVPWLLAGLSTMVLAVARGGTRRPPPEPSTVPGVWELITVLGWALALMAVSVVTLRPNPDDLFYVNLSQWVAEHGTFPVRDTIFSDLAYPAVNFPPVASYDGLVGALAHVLAHPAGDVVYLLVPPVATVLSVLALWRLLRTWRVPHVALTIWIAMAFLLFDGTSSYGSPGNLFVTRLWQGKVILLCVVVPVLLVHALRFVERPTRERARWLLVGGVAATALSTTAIFLVPLIAVAGMLPLARRDPRTWPAGLVGLAAMAAYPLTAGVVTILVGGRSADDFGMRRLYRFDPSWFGHEVFLTGLVALIGVAAALVGHLVVPHPAARLTTSVLVVLVAITFVPGVTHLGYDLLGLGPTLWRVTWGLTLAALVGTAGAHLLMTYVPRRLTPLAGGLALVVLVVLGHPIWASETSTRFVAPLHWQRGAESRGLVARMLRETSPGAVVLVPEGLGVTVAVATTEVKTVAPRTYAMAGLRDEPRFDYPPRLLLQNLVNELGTGSPPEVRGALAALHVSIACVYRDDPRGRLTLVQAGYHVAFGSPTYVCLEPAVQRP